MKKNVRDTRSGRLTVLQGAVLVLVFVLSAQGCGSVTKKPAGEIPAAMGIRG